MAELAVGDKVKYLDRVGGGVIVKVLDPKMVLVAGDDGFEMPVLMTELVKINPSDAGGRFFEGKSMPTGKKPAEPPKGDSDERVEELAPELKTTRTSEDIYIAFVPHDQKYLMTGFIDVYLINNTSFDLLYNLFHKTPLGHFEGVDYGSVFSDSKLLIATVNRENIARWSDGYLQFLFHKAQSSDVLSPFNTEFRIEGKKFFKEGNYRESHLVGGKGIVVKVLSLTQYLGPVKMKEEDKAPVKATETAAGSSVISKHRTGNREAEVDLHIHELVDDPVNLEKGEILDYQKNYFIRCLEAAIADGYLKLTVIHGVGNGILRQVLFDILKNYKGIEIIDAPMSKYGVGAIEIRIPHNRE